MGYFLVALFLCQFRDVWFCIKNNLMVFKF